MSSVTMVPPEPKAEDSFSKDVDGQETKSLHNSDVIPHAQAASSSERVATSVGVKRIEAVARAGEKRPVLMWTVRICILVLGWTYSLQ